MQSVNKAYQDLIRIQYFFRMDYIEQNEHIIYELETNFENGFELLFLAFYKPLKRVAQKTIGEEFSEDVVQDTFMTIWNSKNTFENIQAAKAYLYNTVHHKCLNIIRRENLLEKYQTEHRELLFEESVIEEDLLALLYEALNTLPDHYKFAMERSLMGDSIQTIALTMNTTEDTIKAYKRRSKVLLRKRLCNQAYLLVLF